MPFPAPPFTNGQTHVENGITFVYSTATGSWSRGTTAPPPDVKVTAAAFNTATDTLTLTQSDNSTVSCVIPETNTSLSYNTLTKILTFTNETGTPTNIDLSALAVDIYVNGGTYNTTTGVLTLTDNDGTTADIVIDLSSLKSSMVNNNNGTYTHTVGTTSTIIDTRLPVAALPATGYPDQIVEYNSTLFKWYATPGTWAQIS